MTVLEDIKAVATDPDAFHPMRNCLTQQLADSIVNETGAVIPIDKSFDNWEYVLAALKERYGDDDIKKFDTLYVKTVRSPTGAEGHEDAMRIAEEIFA